VWRLDNSTMVEDFEYKGHHARVATHAVGRGFRWWLSIDGGPPINGEDRPLPSEELILAEGVAEAKLRIDKMAPAAKPG